MGSKTIRPTALPRIIDQDKGRIVYKSLFSLAFSLLFSFAVGLLVTGCSGDSEAPVTPKAAVKHKTFYDPPLRMIGEGKKSTGLSKVVGAEAGGAVYVRGL